MLPYWGLNPQPGLCALTGNPTHHLLVYRTEPQGKILWINDYSQLKKKKFKPTLINVFVEIWTFEKLVYMYVVLHV